MDDKDLFPVTARFSAPLGLLKGLGVLSSSQVRILDRYILREWAKVFALCMASFCGLLLVSDGYNWIPDFLGWGSSTWTIVTYLTAGLVAKVSILIPVSLLVSTVFVLSAMNRNQELAAARAAGIGMWRLTAPLWWVAVLFAAVTALLNAVWVPDALETQRNLVERERFNFIRSKGDVVVPISQGEFVSFQNPKAGRFWLISRLGLQSGQAYEVFVYTFDDRNRLVRCIAARTAEFKKVDGAWKWTFRDGRDQRYDPVAGMLAQPHFDALSPAGYDDDPEVMLFARRDPEDLSLREVSRYVDQTGSNASGQGAAYAMRYHAILSSPAICFVVIAVAIPFAVVGGRINPMVGVAKTFGLFLAYFFLSSLCSAFGVSGALYPVVAAWLPTALTAAWAIPKLRSVN
ncbi:MAG: hypothetical protein RIR91_1317 [Verrucomicrobiota bacterium]|jgi:lipopolysaccharide export system permease protein